MEPTPRKMPIDVTPEILLSKVRSGMTQTDLAREYGVCNARIQQLVSKAMRREDNIRIKIQPL